LKPLHKYILLLFLLNVLLSGTGYFLFSLEMFNVFYGDIAILSTVFSIITLILLVIFFRGQTKEPESQTLHSLVSVVLKFLLELVLAFFWFLVAKKTSLQSVLIFFVIYLTVTFFSITVILKTLKNKSL
jgi:hypothetical protein